MKIKNEGRNIRMCCDEMKDNFFGGIFRVIVDKQGVYFYTTANVKIKFCPFCGVQIKFDKE